VCVLLIVSHIHILNQSSGAETFTRSQAIASESSSAISETRSANSCIYIFICICTYIDAAAGPEKNYIATLVALSFYLSAVRENRRRTRFIQTKRPRCALAQLQMHALSQLVTFVLLNLMQSRLFPCARCRRRFLSLCICICARALSHTKAVRYFKYLLF
jgi:hypothetical protein